MCLCLARLARADEPCDSIFVTPVSTDTRAVLEQASRYVAQGDYARAHGLYAWLLARQPNLRDARLAMARTDGWAQCYDRAATGYRMLLAANPADAEARAGLIDVLLWQNRRQAAERELKQGLSLSNSSPELWQRRSILDLRNDKRQAARSAAERALALAPKDQELQALRDRIYMTLARTSFRVDAFPGAYPNLYKTTLQLWHRIGPVELNADALIQDRAGGALPAPMVDGLYTFGAGYHTGPLATIGVGVGFGAPSHSLPRYLGRLWILSEFAPRWSLAMTYTFWDYPGTKSIHIAAPSVAFAPDDDWRLELRGWGTWLVLKDDVATKKLGFVAAVGVRAVRAFSRSVRLGASYTYGPQLGHVVLTPDFITITSHVFALDADLQLARGFGVQPIVGLEHRTVKQRPMLVVSAEFGVYIRW